MLFVDSLCGESEKNGGIPFELNFIFYTFKTGLIVVWNLLTDLAYLKLNLKDYGNYI